jgi:hypothetical protein
MRVTSLPVPAATIEIVSFGKAVWKASCSAVPFAAVTAA